MKTVTYFQYTGREFEELIKSVYNKEYDIHLGEMLGVDTQLAFQDVQKDTPEENKKDVVFIKRWLKDQYPNWILEVVLHDMVTKEIIPEGNYLIYVD